MSDKRWANIWKSTRGTWSSAMLTGERKILKKIKSIQKSGNLACKFFDRKTLQTFFDQVQLFHVWPWTKSTTRSSTQRRRKEQVSHVSLKKEMPSLKCRKTVSTCRVVYLPGLALPVERQNDRSSQICSRIRRLFIRLVVKCSKNLKTALFQTFSTWHPNTFWCFCVILT